MTNEACWRVVGAFQRGHWTAGAAIEFYKTNIAACRTDGTSRKMLDYCRCRLQREYDSRVQPLAPSGKARTEVHSGALAFHAYAGRDRCCQDHPVAPPASAARRCAQSHSQDVQCSAVECRAEQRGALCLSTSAVQRAAGSCSPSFTASAPLSSSDLARQRQRSGSAERAAALEQETVGAPVDTPGPIGSPQVGRQART